MCCNTLVSARTKKNYCLYLRQPSTYYDYETENRFYPLLEDRNLIDEKFNWAHSSFIARASISFAAFADLQLLIHQSYPRN